MIGGKEAGEWLQEGGRRGASSGVIRAQLCQAVRGTVVISGSKLQDWGWGLVGEGVRWDNWGNERAAGREGAISRELIVEGRGLPRRALAPLIAVSARLVRRGATHRNGCRAPRSGAA